MAEETVDTGTENPTADVEAKAEDNLDITKNDGGSAENNTEDVDSSKGEEEKTDTPETIALDYDAVKLPEGVTVSDKEKADFKETVEKFGFKDQQSLQNFVDWIFKVNADELAKSEAKAEEAKAAEQKEWEEIKSKWKSSLEGDADFGKEYDANMKRATDAMTKFGGSELIEALKGIDYMENPAIVKTFARIGKEIEDARLLTGKQSVETNKRPRDRYNQPMLVYKD